MCEPIDPEDLHIPTLSAHSLLAFSFTHTTRGHTCTHTHSANGRGNYSIPRLSSVIEMI